MQRSLKEAGIEAGGACEITDVDALDDEIRQLRA